MTTPCVWGYAICVRLRCSESRRRKDTTGEKRDALEETAPVHEHSFEIAGLDWPSHSTSFD
jgi:hypothetical protein